MNKSDVIKKYTNWCHCLECSNTNVYEGFISILVASDVPDGTEVEINDLTEYYLLGDNGLASRENNVIKLTEKGKLFIIDMVKARMNA